MEINIYTEGKSFLGRAYHLIAFGDLLVLSNGCGKTKKRSTIFKSFQSFIKTSYILRTSKETSTICARITKDMCLDCTGNQLKLLILIGKYSKTFDLKDFTVDAYGKNFTFSNEKEVDKFINFSIESEIEVELLTDGFFFENASNENAIFHVFSGDEITFNYENRN